MSGTFIMVEGLDGSGKGVVIDALSNYLSLQGKRVLDLRAMWKEENRIPEVEELEEYDVVVSAEPTYSLIGKVIREEIISNKHDRKYSGLSTAQAFSLDREILYKKLIIPALHAGKTVLQERGFVTSMVYQPVQKERLALQDVMHLPGNQIALKNSPTVLILTQVDPNVTVQRLKKREKKDDAIFENLLFQQKLDERYRSEWLKQLFEKHGTKVVYLDTNYPKTVEDTQKAAVQIYKDIVEK